MNIDHVINSALAPAVNDWFRRQCADPCQAYYLYVRKARPGEAIAVPVIATEAPNEDYWLAMPERLSNAWTVERAQYRCFEALRTEPILGASLIRPIQPNGRYAL